MQCARCKMRGARFALSARAMYMRILFHDPERAYRLSCPIKPRSWRGQMLQLRRCRFHAGSWLASGRCSQRTRFNQLARFFSLSSTMSSSRLLRWPRRAGAGPDSPHLHLAQCGRSALTGSLHSRHENTVPAAAHCAEQKALPRRRTGCRRPGADAFPHSRHRSGAVLSHMRWNCSSMSGERSLSFFHARASAPWGAYCP